MDEIFDFAPEEGDTIVLKRNEKTPRKLTFDKIEINHKGDVRVNLGASNWKNIVNLKRGSFTFKVEQKGSRAYLRFGGKF